MIIWWKNNVLRSPSSDQLWACVVRANQVSFSCLPLHDNNQYMLLATGFVLVECKIEALSTLTKHLRRLAIHLSRTCRRRKARSVSLVYVYDAQGWDISRPTNFTGHKDERKAEFKFIFAYIYISLRFYSSPASSSFALNSNPSYLDQQSNTPDAAFDNDTVKAAQNILSFLQETQFAADTEVKMNYGDAIGITETLILVQEFCRTCSWRAGWKAHRRCHKATG